MAATLARTLEQVKDDLPRLIQCHVLDCLAEHADWRWRDRLLNPLNTVMLFVTQVLHGNTAMTHLRHLSGMNFTPTAYCRARMRLPLALLQQLSQRITHRLLAECDDVSRWHGHRVWHGDGSSFSMPDTPALADHFGRPGAQAQGCGFPVATLLVLCNAAGLIVQTLALPLRCHEASQLTRVHDQLDEGDVLVYDRAGCSWTHLALLCGRNLHAIFRMHQKQIVSFRPGRQHASRQMRRKGKGQGKPSSQ